MTLFTFIIHQVSDSDFTDTGSGEICKCWSQSLIHQVSDSDILMLEIYITFLLCLNPLFIRSQIQMLSVVHLMPFNGKVSIPYSSGLRFRCLKRLRRNLRIMNVSIPYSSGLRFRWFETKPTEAAITGWSLNPLFIRSQIQM